MSASKSSDGDKKKADEAQAASKQLLEAMEEDDEFEEFEPEHWGKLQQEEEAQQWMDNWDDDMDDDFTKNLRAELLKNSHPATTTATATGK
jgi:DSS1/SEM1 family